MKRYFVLAVVALGLVFTACDEEENLNSSVWIGSELESNVIAQLDNCIWMPGLKICLGR